MKIDFLKLQSGYNRLIETQLKKLHTNTYVRYCMLALSPHKGVL